MKSGDLTAEVVGDIEKDGVVLVLKRIHVSYKLRGGDREGDREKVERVHDAHASHCPVARSLDGAIAITTEVEYLD